MSETAIDTDVKTESGTKPDKNDVPRYRLNEEIAKLKDARTTIESLNKKIETYELKEEDAKKEELVQQEKWQELNAELQKEIDSYKPFKDKFESLDGKMREEALSKLSESKQEKFKNLNTADLLNVVDELSIKTNPPEGAGTIDAKIPKDSWKKMDLKEKRSNWSGILDSYKR